MSMFKNFLVPFVIFIPAWGQDNGIHVAPPKVYDARALQLMMDELADSLKKTSFIDPKALAKPWTTTFYYELKPDWELQEISCSGDYPQYNKFENDKEK